MPAAELRPTTILNVPSVLNSEKSVLLGNYDPAMQLGMHARLHQESGFFVVPFVAGRDPGTGNTISKPWDAPFPLEVLSVFCSIGTVAATSLSFNVKKATTSILVNGPLAFLNAGGNNQKGTIEAATGPGTVRLSPTLVLFNNGDAMNVEFIQAGAGTLTDMQAMILCRRRFSA